MTTTGVFETWNRDSELYERYTESASSLLATDAELQAARAEWEEFFVDSHGDVFAQVDVANPREQIFVDALYFDFVVDRILDFAERTFEFTLTNREPSHDTDALSFDFRSLHDRVLDVESVNRDVAESLTAEDLLTADVGFLRTLYEAVVSREVRLALGEYYTPKGVVELAVEELSIDDVAGETFLDPGCGSGVFLAVCIDRKRDALAGDRPPGEDGHSPGEVVRAITDTVYGIDLNPVAVKGAKLGYVLSLLPSLEAADADAVEVPVFLADSLRLTRDDGLPEQLSGGDFAVDHLVGNPPWITWGNLSEAVKAAWRERYADRLDLLPHQGAETRLGHGNDDVSVPFVWVCIHHYLREGGDASFVLKRDIMKGPAGKLLRTQSLNGRSVSVRSVHDFNQLRPFGEQVGASAAIYVLSADEEPEFPVSATSWTSDSTAPDFSTVEAIRETLDREATGFVPVDADDPTSSWVRRDAERRALGECDHQIRHGLKDDAKAVFAVEREQLADLESDLVYPYLKSKHVVKYGLFGHDLHLVPMEKTGRDNEDELREEYPRTYDYLRENRDRLAERSSSWLERGPFYNVFGLGEYTWADYKVVWCRLGFKPHFAVVSTVEDDDLGEKTVVPGDHLMFVATDSKREAHFLTALLNSSVYQKCLQDMASEGKASLSKTVVSKLELPEYRKTPESRRLAELSMEAHDIVPEHTDVSKREYNRTTIPELEAVQAEIDEIVEGMLAEGSVFSGNGRGSF